MIYSFQDQNYQISKYLISKIDSLDKKDPKEIANSIKKKIIKGIDYGCPDIINEGCRLAILKKNSLAIDVFLELGADPELHNGRLIKEAIKINNEERLFRIFSKHPIDVSQYIEIPEDVSPDNITDAAIYSSNKNYLSNINKTQEEIQSKIYSVSSSSESHTTYQKLKNLFEQCENMEQAVHNATKLAFNNQNKNAIDILVFFQTDDKFFEQYTNRYLENKNPYLLDLVIGQKNIKFNYGSYSPQVETENIIGDLTNYSDNILAKTNDLYLGKNKENNFNNFILKRNHALDLFNQTDVQEIPVKLNLQVVIFPVIEQETVKSENNTPLVLVEQENNAPIVAIVAQEEIKQKMIYLKPIGEKLNSTEQLPENSVKKKNPILNNKKHIQIVDGNNNILTKEDIQTKWNHYLIKQYLDKSSKKMQLHLHHFMLENKVSERTLRFYEVMPFMTPHKSKQSEKNSHVEHFVKSFHPEIANLLDNGEDVLNNLNTYSKKTNQIKKILPKNLDLMVKHKKLKL